LVDFMAARYGGMENQDLMFGGLGNLIGGAIQQGIKLAPGVIEATPGILNGVTGIINAAKGREFEDLSQEEQELFLGALAALAPLAIQAAPGIVKGVSGIVKAAKGKEEQDLGFSINGGFKKGPFSANIGWSREQEDMFLGALASLAPLAIQAVPGIIGGVSDIVRAAKGREE